MKASKHDHLTVSYYANKPERNSKMLAQVSNLDGDIWNPNQV